MVQFTLKLILVKPRLTEPHRPAVGGRRDFPGASHQPLLLGTLDQPEIVQHMVEIRELTRWHRPVRLLGPYGVDPVHDLPVEVCTAPHGVIDAVSPLYQTRKNVINVADGEGIVGAEATAGALRTGTVTMP